MQNKIIKLAVLTPFFTGKLGGPYDVINELAFHLGNKGVHFTIYTSSSISQKGKKITESFQKISDSLFVKRFNMQLKFREYRMSFGLIPQFMKDVKKIDIIHSHAPRSYQEDIGLFMALAKKKPFIINPHGGININWDYSDKIPKMIHDRSIGFFKHNLIKPYYIGVSKSEVKIIKSYGIETNFIHYIPNGVNTEIFRPVESMELKEKLNLDNCDVLLYVGRIAKGKGVDKLIKVLYHIIKKKENIKLVIVGADGGYLPIVKSLIKKFQLSKQVIFTGHVTKYDLPKYYSLADIVIYPSRQEIFGLVITEAMACGKPVIGSNILGPSEIIDHGKTGITSDFKNIQELSEIIINLLEDKKKLSIMGKNALESVKKKYSWEKAADAYYLIYNNILGK